MKTIILKKFQNHVRTKLKFLNNIKKEINFIYKAIENLIKRIENSLVTNIISQNKFNENMLEIEDIYSSYKNIVKNKITCKFLANKTKKYNIVLEISKIKLNLINIIKTCGSQSIEDIIKLILNQNELNLILKKYSEIYKLYNSYFNPTGFIFYTKNDEINIIKENSNINNYPICVKNKDIQISLIEKLLGANIYLPINNKLILIKGFFNEDPLNLTRSKGLLKNKNTKLIKKIKKISNIPDNI